MWRSLWGPESFRAGQGRGRQGWYAYVDRPKALRSRRGGKTTRRNAGETRVAALRNALRIEEEINCSAEKLHCHNEVTPLTAGQLGSTAAHPQTRLHRRSPFRRWCWQPTHESADPLLASFMAATVENDHRASVRLLATTAGWAPNNLVKTNYKALFIPFSSVIVIELARFE